MQKLLGGNKKYNPDELVDKILKNLSLLEATDEKQKEKARVDTQKYLERVRDLFQQSNQSADTSNDQVVKLKKLLSDKALIEKFIKLLPKVTFESKKYIQFIISNLVRKPVSADQENSVVKIFRENPDNLAALVKNYERKASEIALNSGQILRDCIRDSGLAKIVLENHYLQLVEYSNLSSFDIQSDAFSTLKELLTTHKPMVKDYVLNNYDEFIKIYTTKLIRSENYVTKRQSIKLLSDFLLDRVNLKIMTKYISDPENLKAIMQLLLDDSESIKFEAFHVFKVFAANPNKSKPVLKLLIINKKNLTEFLNNFQSDQRQDDENFHEERRYLADLIENLSMGTSLKENTNSNNDNENKKQEA